MNEKIVVKIIEEFEFEDPYGDKSTFLESQILCVQEIQELARRIVAVGSWESKKTKANMDLQFEDNDGTEFFREYAIRNKMPMEGCFCDVLNLKNANKGNDTDEKLTIFKYHNILLAYIIEFRDEFNFAYRYYFSKNLTDTERKLLNLEAMEVLNQPEEISVDVIKKLDNEWAGADTICERLEYIHERCYYYQAAPNMPKIALDLSNEVINLLNNKEPRISQKQEVFNEENGY
jgi:hypothetical protein